MLIREMLYRNMQTIHNAIRKWNPVQALNDRGDMVVELLIKMMLIMVVVFLFLQMIPIITIHTNMSLAATQLARTVELTGKTTTSPQYQEHLNFYKDQWEFMNDVDIRVDPVDPIEGWFDRSADKLKFRKPFTIKMNYTYHLKLINTTMTHIGTIDIPISKSVHGTSEIYWKE